MINKKVSGFFISDREMEKIKVRTQLLEKVLNEINNSVECMTLSKGRVWKWFHVNLWRTILMESGLSNDGKLKVLRECVLEKLKYQNMGEKGMRSFIETEVIMLKNEEKKARRRADRVGESHTDTSKMKILPLAA